MVTAGAPTVSRRETTATESTGSNDEGVMTSPPAPDDRGDPAHQLLALYDDALPEVYGYLVRRLGSGLAAEELCAETFYAALASARRGAVRFVTIAWLIGIARNKLVDHWRRQAREQRMLSLVVGQSATDDEPWQGELDDARAIAVLSQLLPDQRSALTLRYLDGMPVPAVAAALGRTVHATESLLMRAKSSFRQLYLDRRHHDA
jgi:RNA polymerase sigma-70 factor, ECF subfamily